MSITGPWSRTTTIGTAIVKYQKWYRQPAPYVLPLTYDMAWNKYVEINRNYSPCSPLAKYAENSPCYDRAYARAYAKFKDLVSEAASLAVNFAERKEAIDMMTKRVTQIYRFARCLGKYDFVGAGSALGLEFLGQKGNTFRFKKTEALKRDIWYEAKSASLQKPVVSSGVNLAPVSGQMRKKIPKKKINVFEVKLKRAASSFGSNYLEYHFGWEPLMKDIEASIDLFTNPLRVPYGNRVVARSTSQTSVIHPTGSLYSVSEDYDWVSHVSIRATVSLSNPNAYRLEQLGLLNLAVLGWELIPFSFIVDWFVNVGDFLSSFTDFAGLTLSRQSVTHKTQYAARQFYRTYVGGPPNYPIGDVQVRQFIGYAMTRRTVITFPSLIVRPPKWPSVVRCTTAISLLTGFYDTVQHRK